MQFSDFNNWYASTFAPTFTGDSNFANVRVDGNQYTKGDIIIENHILPSDISTLELHGAGQEAPGGFRGGNIGWYYNTGGATDNLAGATFINQNKQFVWSPNAQQANIDAGIAWIDFDNGDANFHDVNFANIGISGNIYGDSSTVIQASKLQCIDCTASGSGAIAIGSNESNLIANGIGSFAMGYASAWSGTSNLVASGNGSIAMGLSERVAATANFYSTGAGSVAMGYSDNNTIAQGKGAIALGYNVKALEEASVTLGKDLTNYNANSVLVQDLNVLGDLNGTDIGLTGNIYGDSSTVITADKYQSITGIASGTDAVALGLATDALGDYSTALGVQTTASGVGSFAVGSVGGGEISTEGEGSIVMGMATGAAGGWASLVSRGSGAIASGFTNVAGANGGIEATSEASFAHGYVTTIFGSDVNIISSGFGAVAIGMVNNSGEIEADGSGSVAMGYANNGWLESLGNGSVAMGYTDTNSSATGTGAIALGYNAQALAEAAITLGKNLTNYNANSVLVQDFNAVGFVTIQDLNVWGSATFSGGVDFNGGEVSVGTSVANPASGSIGISQHRTLTGSVGSDNTQYGIYNFINDKRGSAMANEKWTEYGIYNYLDISHPFGVDADDLNFFGTYSKVRYQDSDAPDEAIRTTYGVYGEAEDLSSAHDSTGESIAYGIFGKARIVGGDFDNEPASAYGGYFEGIASAADDAPATSYGIFATASGGDIDYAGYFQGNITVTGDSNFLGDLMITGKSFASSHVDHTPGWEGTSQEALEQLLQVETGPDGELVHSTLPEFTRVKLPYTKPEKESKAGAKGMKAQSMTIGVEAVSTDTVEVDEATTGRDLGATITMLTEATKALNEKIEEAEPAQVNNEITSGLRKCLQSSVKTKATVGAAAKTRQKNLWKKSQLKKNHL